MKTFFDRIAPFFPFIGLLLLALGALSYLITRRFDLLTNALLLSGALLLLLFAVLRPDDVRRFFSRRQTRYGSTTLLSVILFAAIAVLLFWIAYQNPDWRYDTTEEGAFTPLPETVELLQNLEEPIHIIAFYPPSMAFQQEQAADTLESMQAISDLVSFEFQDPESNPVLAEQYELNFPGTLVFVRNPGPDEVFTKANSLNDSDIHSALSQVINPLDKKAYFLTGHGELDIDSFEPTGMGTIVGVIEDQGFEVAELSLFTEGGVPEDATVVALIGQQTPLDPAEAEALTAYVEGGGALFLARDPLDSEGRAAAEDDGVADLMQQVCGVTFRNDAIIDQDLAQAGQEFGLSFLGSSYGTHVIVTDDLRLFGTRFVLARSVDTGDGTGAVTTELVRTSESSWGETRFDLLSAGVAQIDPEDATGPLAVAVSCENNEQGSRIVAIGDSDFITNETVIYGGNGLLFANSMNWLADDELAIDLAPRETIERQVNIPQTQLTALQLVSICLAPLVVGLIGVAVFASRRRRR